MPILYSSTPTECKTPRMNPQVNYELWVMMYQCRFINCNKSTTPVGNVDNGGYYTLMRAGSI